MYPTSVTSGFASVYEIQVTCEIDMSEEKEGPHFEDKESSKEIKEKSNLLLIFPNCRKLCAELDINQFPLT